jgi:hypothetical protein
LHASAASALNPTKDRMIAAATTLMRALLYKTKLPLWALIIA